MRETASKSTLKGKRKKRTNKRQDRKKLAAVHSFLYVQKETIRGLDGLQSTQSFSQNGVLPKMSWDDFLHFFKVPSFRIMFHYFLYFLEKFSIALWSPVASNQAYIFFDKVNYKFICTFNISIVLLNLTIENFRSFYKCLLTGTVARIMRKYKDNKTLFML